MEFDRLFVPHFDGAGSVIDDALTDAAEVAVPVLPGGESFFGDDLHRSPQKEMQVDEVGDFIDGNQ